MSPIIVGLGLVAAATPDPHYLYAQREKRLALESLADCLVQSQPRKIETALEADPSSAAYEKWADGLWADCYLKVAKDQSVWVRPDAAALEYALAEALFRRTFRSIYLVQLQIVPPLPQGIADYKWRNTDHKPSAAEIEQERVSKENALYFSVLAECIVRADPMGTNTLLSSAAWTPDEDRAFDALMPAISGCIDEKKQISMDRENLRGALALNYIRLAHASSQQQQVLRSGSHK